MTAIGRPMETIEMNGRSFQCVGDSAGIRDLGGYTSEWQSNGNPSTGRLIMTPSGWSVSGQPVQIDDSQGDQEFVTSLKNSPNPVDFIFTYGGGIVYAGTGHIVEATEFDAMAASMSLTMRGGGELKKL